jgi:hypothetical protein
MQRQMSTPEMPIFPREEEEEDDLEAKPEKAPVVLRSSSERSIHLIPVLTVLCFVVLFICSHAPSSSGTLYIQLPRLLIHSGVSCF